MGEKPSEMENRQRERTQEEVQNRKKERLWGIILKNYDNWGGYKGTETRKKSKTDKKDHPGSTKSGVAVNRQLSTKYRRTSYQREELKEMFRSKKE